MKRSVFGSFVENAIEPSVPSISVAHGGRLHVFLFFHPARNHRTLVVVER
jgi:hypothetical protein